MNPTTKFMNILFFSYIGAYFSIFLEMIFPKKELGYSTLSFYFLIYLFINYIFINTYLKIVEGSSLHKKLKKSFLSPLLFSSSLGLVSVMILNIYTTFKINARAPFENSSYLVGLNFNYIILIFVIMLSLSMLINLVYIKKKIGKFNEQNLSLLWYTFFFYAVFAVINYVVCVAYIFLGLGWY